MNHLGQNSQRNIYWLILGSAIGGLAGYMISEVIVDRLLYGDPDWVKEKDDDIVVLTDDTPAGTTVILNTRDMKPALEELTRDYTVSSEENTVETRIVSKETVDRLADMTNLETLFYYERDQTFAYESGDRIEDPNDLLVPNVHLHFGEGNPDKDIVYIWNAELSMYFEVVCKDESYAVAILGEEEVVTEKPKSKDQRRIRSKAKPKTNPASEVAEELHEDDGA